jgi:hypothetical protein
LYGYPYSHSKWSDHATEEKIVGSGQWRVFGSVQQRNIAYEEIVRQAVREFFSDPTNFEAAFGA